MSPLIGSPRSFFRSGVAPSAFFPHEPAGTIFTRTHPFDGAIGGTTAIAGQWARNAGGADSIVAYANSPFGTGKTGRMHFEPTVPAAGSGPGFLFTSPNITEVATLYICHWLRLPIPWSNTKDGSTPGGFKTLFTQIHNIGATSNFANSVFGFLSSPSEHGTIHYEVWLQNGAPPVPGPYDARGPASFQGQNLNLAANIDSSANIITPGTLACVEWRFVMNTPGVRDGIVEAWCAKDYLSDPTLVLTHSYTNVGFVGTGYTAKFCEVFWNPTKGGAGWQPVAPAPGPPISQAQDMDIPHIRISGL